MIVQFGLSLKKPQATFTFIMFPSPWSARSTVLEVLHHLVPTLCGALPARCAGHSLGGAMAILAAHDVASQCGVPTVQARSYTHMCRHISFTLSLFHS